MAKHILKCTSCKEYCLNVVCPKCGGNALECKPAKYSPDDKYAEYRRKYKQEQEKKDNK